MKPAQPATRIVCLLDVSMSGDVLNAGFLYQRSHLLVGGREESQQKRGLSMTRPQLKKNS
jgi:hypothetical protein